MYVLLSPMISIETINLCNCQRLPICTDVAKAGSTAATEQTEQIMSTLALRAAGLFASAVKPQAGSSFIERFLAAHDDRAKRRVAGMLAAMDDARLAGLGFSAEDMAALRAGEHRLPR